MIVIISIIVTISCSPVKIKRLQDCVITNFNPASGKWKAKEILTPKIGFFP